MNENYFVDEYGIKVDKVELTEEYKKVIDEVEAKIDQFKKERSIGGFGSCHIIWAKKKEILKKDYGIDWMSPAELNETIMFD